MIDTKERILVAVYRNETEAQHAVENLNEKGCAMTCCPCWDALTRPATTSLHLLYERRARMKAWARQGALWGALWAW